MTPNIDVIESRLYAGSVADEIIASLNEFIDEHGKVSFVLSGGSTPATVYRALACPPRVNEVDWSKVTLFWGDERWVPRDDDQSNFKMAHETLIAKLPKPGPRTVAVDTSLGSPEESAMRYEEAIIKSGVTLKDGVPVFDMVLLGMGEDGHIASVFPNSPLVKIKEGVCRADICPTDGTKRITLVPPTIFAASKVLFLVMGDAKADIVRRVMAKDGDENQYPARLYEGYNSKVSWFMDSAAARKMNG